MTLWKHLIAIIRVLDPNDYIIARRRKKYKFALFANSPLCFEFDEWEKASPVDVLEIGAGTGLFSVALAELGPEQQFLAVDVKADRLQTGAHLAAERSLTNIRFLRARAGQLTDIITPHSLQTIWITFPDPFPKKRASKNRLTHAQFLAIYTQLLKKDGALYFKTDSHDLFTWSLEQLVREKWTMAELSFDLHGSDLPETYKVKTTYETRYTNEGLPINFVKATPPSV